MGHTISFDKIEILYQSPSWELRLVCESLEIKLHQGVLHREEGALLSTAWLAVIEHLCKE